MNSVDDSKSVSLKDKLAHSHIDRLSNIYYPAMRRTSKVINNILNLVIIKQSKEHYMTQTVTFKGTPVSVGGQFPKVGSKAPAFTLVGKDLADITLTTLAGKRKVLNIFPSIDTGVCATSVRKFNELASSLDNTVVVCVAADLPFAQARFCGAEGIENVVTGSTFRSTFLNDYGVLLNESALKGLAARAVVVIDENDNVIHAELVAEIGSEPNYEAVSAVLN